MIYLEYHIKKNSVFFPLPTMLLLNFLNSGKGNSSVMLIERAAHPALESKVLRFFFRSVFFRQMLETIISGFFFREKKLTFTVHK